MDRNSTSCTSHADSSLTEFRSVTIRVKERHRSRLVTSIFKFGQRILIHMKTRTCSEAPPSFFLLSICAEMEAKPNN